MALLTGVATPLLYFQTRLKPLCFSWRCQAAEEMSQHVCTAHA